MNASCDWLIASSEMLFSAAWHRCFGPWNVWRGLRLYSSQSIYIRTWSSLQNALRQSRWWWMQSACCLHSSLPPHGIECAVCRVISAAIPAAGCWSPNGRIERRQSRNETDFHLHLMFHTVPWIIRIPLTQKAVFRLNHRHETIQIKGLSQRWHVAILSQLWDRPSGNR